MQVQGSQIAATLQEETHNCSEKQWVLKQNDLCSYAECTKTGLMANFAALEVNRRITSGRQCSRQVNLEQFPHCVKEVHRTFP